MSNRKKGKTIAIFDQANIDVLIPKRAIQLLPLKPEPINNWKVRTLDSVDFIKHVCDKDSYVTYEDGRRRKVNFKSYWRFLHNSSLSKFKAEATQFTLKAKTTDPVPASIVRVIKVPNLLSNKYYGNVAKYYSCYNAIIDSALSESYFFSLAHLIESQEELDCSILLAQNLYYKQSLQVLRNFIELLVSQILFCWDSSEFKRWIKGDFRLPKLRGKGGLLEILLNAKQISDTLCNRTAKSYESLNSYIHSSEQNLIHRGQYEGHYKGYIFDVDYFENWCKSFSDIVDNGIMLLDAHFNQISQLTRKGLVCSVCHSEKDWEVEGEEEFAGVNYIKLKCKQCRHKVTHRKDVLIFN